MKGRNLKNTEIGDNCFVSEMSLLKRNYVLVAEPWFLNPGIIRAMQEGVQPIENGC